MGKPMENRGKPMENHMETHGKPHGKPWETTWETMENHGKTPFLRKLTEGTAHHFSDGTAVSPRRPAGDREAGDLHNGSRAIYSPTDLKQPKGQVMAHKKTSIN